MKNYRKHFLNISGILFIILIAYIIYSANRGSLPLLFRQLIMFPGGDKVAHIVLLGILSLFVNYFLYPRHICILGKSIFTGTLTVLCFITLEEISQLFIPMRAFDLLDLICSYLGILLGDVSVRYMIKSRLKAYYKRLNTDAQTRAG